MAELLKVSLATGDGGDAMALWQQIGANLGGAHTGGDDRIDMAGRTGYQSMLRSCATMALYEVDVTTARLIEQGYPHDGMRPSDSAGITGEPEWMTELADASIAGEFLRGPKTIAFVRENPTMILGIRAKPC